MAKTAAELTVLSAALDAYALRIDAYVRSSADPFADPMQQLGGMGAAIALDAATVARLAVETLEEEVGPAVVQLGGSIGDARTALETLTRVKSVISVTAAVLSAASAMSTANPLRAAASVLSLVNVIDGACAAATA